MAETVKVYPDLTTVYDIITNLVNTTTLSGASILESLRTAGVQIRTQTFYDLLNYTKGAGLSGRNYVGTLGPNTLPLPSRLAKTPTPRKNNYYYYVTVTGENEETGELDVQDVTVISQTLLNKQQVLDKVFGFFVDPEAEYEIKFGTAEVTDIQVNSGGVTP